MSEGLISDGREWDFPREWHLVRMRSGKERPGNLDRLWDKLDREFRLECSVSPFGFGLWIFEEIHLDGNGTSMGI